MQLLSDIFSISKFSKGQNSKTHVGGAWFLFSAHRRGWSGGAMVLGKTSSAGASYNLDDSRARAYCACSRCGWEVFAHLSSPPYFLFSFFLPLGDGPI